MASKTKTLFLLMFLSIYSWSKPSFGQLFLGQNLLQCESHSGHFRNCILQHPIIAARMPTEVSFSISYTYQCSGTDLTIGIEQQDQTDPTLHTLKKGSHTLSFSGFGPLQVVDKKPRLTLIGQFANDCTVRIDKIDRDISLTTQERITDKIAHIESFLHLLSETKKLSMLSESILTLASKIDISSLGSLLITLHASTLSTRNSYLRKGLQNEMQAIDRILLNLEATICDNPALRDLAKQLCKIEATPDNTDNDLTAPLKQFSLENENIIVKQSALIGKEITDTFTLISYASQATQNLFHKKVCAFNNNECVSESIKSLCHEFEKNEQ